MRLSPFDHIQEKITREIPEVLPERADTHYDEDAALADTLETLGIELRAGRRKKVNLTDRFAIRFLTFSPEDVVLARAMERILQDDHHEEIPLIFEKLEGSYMLEGDTIVPIRYFGRPAFSFPGRDELTSSMVGFRKYTQSKLLSHAILRRYGLPVPRELVLRRSRFSHISPSANTEDTIEQYRLVEARTQERIHHFLQDGAYPESGYVIKPDDREQGRGVYMMPRGRPQYPRVSDVYGWRQKRLEHARTGHLRCAYRAVYQCGHRGSHGQ